MKVTSEQELESFGGFYDNWKLLVDKTSVVDENSVLRADQRSVFLGR